MRQELEFKEIHARLDAIESKLDTLEDSHESLDEELDAIRHKINLCRNDPDEDEVESPSYLPTSDDSD